MLRDIAQNNPDKPQVYLRNIFQTIELRNKAIEAREIARGLGLPPSAVLYVEKKSGDLKVSMASGKGERKLYDAKNDYNLPGEFKRGENGAATSDEVLNRAFDYSGLMREFIRVTLTRNSIDDRGMDLISSVHYGVDYNNAFWNSEQMTYGDGDKDIFNTFVLIDVVGHELAHGITEHTSGLRYYSQSGSLNEHYSDVAGICLKQWYLKQQPSEDEKIWRIGDEIWGPGVNKSEEVKSLRNMLYPGTAYKHERIGKDKQPAHMDQFVVTEKDNGGVHINSGICNRAFVLACLKMGGPAWEKPWLIWSRANFKYTKENSQFTDFANATLKASKDLYPKEPAVQEAVRYGWTTVGVLK